MVVRRPRRPFRWPAPRARLTPASSHGRRPLENRRPPVSLACYTRSTPHMVTNVIWFIAVTLEVTILFRAFTNRTLLQYPYFYGYLGYVLFQDVLRISIYASHRELYQQVYWSTQFVGLLFGCGVVWEIYKLALGPFPGAQRVARYVFGLVALLLVLKAASGIGHPRLNWAISTTVDLERDLRFVQAIAISALLSVFAFYGLSLGRNLRGLTLGYGVFVASSVINLAVRSRLGDGFQRWWQYLQPLLYVVVLLIWCAALWRYSATSSPSHTVSLAEDYARLVSSTRARLGELRSHVNRGIKS